MGVKSTVDLTLEQAKERFASLSFQVNYKAMRKQLLADAEAMSTVDLANVLEDLNDALAGGEGCENYRIVEDGK